MLSLLKIQNLALVEDLAWEPRSGLIGVTGETGAGKSVIVGALKLVLGERADRGLVRTGCSACSVEALFELPQPEEANAVLEEAGLNPCEHGQLVVRRVITKSGGNKQFVNCSPVTLGVMKQLGRHLVDLHGPHDHQSLLSRERQLAMLDAHAGASGLMRKYSQAYEFWRGLCQQHEALITSERATEHEIDLLRHQVAEIEAADLRPDEAGELEQRHRLARNGSQLMASAGSVLTALEADAGGINGTLAELARAVRELERLDPATADFTGGFDTALLELEELTDNLRTYSDGLETDPSQLAELEARLDLLENLKRKYGNTLAEVLEFQITAQEKLARIEDRGGELQRLEAEIGIAQQQLEACSRKLSSKRKRGAPKLAREIAAHLGELDLGHADFSIQFQALEAPVPHGAESIEFMLSPNPGEPQKALRSIASSGEMSRVMLAAKSALAEQDAIPLLVFDEIDANVGGEIARAVGAKMASLATAHQIIAITHLPQVASLASCHYVVSKEFGKDGRTRSLLKEVTSGQRIDEVARMLGGTAASARKHAENLIDQLNLVA